MNRSAVLALAFGLALAGSAQAQTTATCNDGTTYSGASRSGACSHHGGVKEWTPPPAGPHCVKGKPCGNSCIAMDKVCHK